MKRLLLAHITAVLVAFGLAPSLALADAPAAPPPMDFGNPPSGEIPIFFNDHHVYSRPDLMSHGRVLSALVFNGTLLVPMRSMFEQMGATVTYDGTTKSVTASKPGAEVQVTLGKSEVLINGESRPLDVPPMRYKGAILVPVRVISEALGAYVQWVPEQKAVVVRYIPPTPVPTPPPTPPPPPPTPKPTLPPIPAGWDPCGGPLELENKIGITPCVFVAGEAALTAQYISSNIPSNTSLNVNTRLGTFGTSFSTAAHIIGYPASTVYIGVLPRAEIYMTPPSFLQVNSSAAGALTGNNVLAAGASDMTFGFKNLFLIDPKKLTMAGLDLSYKAPTGSQAFRGPGPSYTINTLLMQPLPNHVGITFGFPVNNFTTVTTTCSSAVPPTCTTTNSRGWSFTPQAVLWWQSPGGTLFAVVAEHSFNPDTWPVGGSLTQLFGRHFDAYVSYGGFPYTAAGTGPYFGLVNVTTKTYPTLLSAGVNVLFGRSDLPPAVVYMMEHAPQH